MKTLHKTKTNNLAAFFIILLSTTLISIPRAASQQVPPASSGPKTSFQTGAPWSPGVNLPADIAMVYGLNTDGVQQWRQRGYTVWSMIGASWLGKDEDVVKNNPDIVQKMAGGVPFEMIQGRAWVVPVGPWREHIKGTISKLIEAGTGAILPEEPEFFVGNGYSEAFKKEWEKYYNEDWRAPNSSLTAQWKANKLKGALFTDFYREIFAYTKSLNPAALTLVPAHSNLNYAHWGIVAPQHAFLSLHETDGMIGQVWTGTAKGSHPVGGNSARAVFDYAYLEYNYFANLAEGTGKQMWLLTDPVEDEPGASWSNLRSWYEDTLTAALMQKSVDRYEIAPWPDRFLQTTGLYGGKDQPQIPQEYATELMTVWAAQRMMSPYGNINSHYGNIGFLTADSLMYQRGSGRDRFKGHIAPMLSLLRRGIHVDILSAERFLEKDYPPKDIRLIVASFDAWKPEKPEIVDAIAAWAGRGGILLFLGGSDDYDNIENAWWKTEKREVSKRETPADALLARLLFMPVDKTVFNSSDKLGANAITGGVITERRILKPAPGAPPQIAQFATISVTLPVTSYSVPGARVWMTTSTGKPVVWTYPAVPINPTSNYGYAGQLLYAGFPGEAVAQSPEVDKLFEAVIDAATESMNIKTFAQQDRISVLRRPFVITHAFSPGVKVSGGSYINILRPEDPATDTVTLDKGGNAVLLDLGLPGIKCRNDDAPCLLLAGGNVISETRDDKSYTLTLAGPENRFGVAWILLWKLIPASITATLPNGTKIDIKKPAYAWDATKYLLRVTIPLSPEGTAVKVLF